MCCSFECPEDDLRVFPKPIYWIGIPRVGARNPAWAHWRKDMEDEAPYRNDMRFRQSGQITGEAFNVGCAKSKGGESIKQVRLGEDWLRQVPSFEATAFGKGHRIVRHRQRLFSGIAGLDAAAVGGSPQPLPAPLSVAEAQGVRGEAVAGQEHRHHRGIEIHRGRPLQSACGIGIRTTHARPSAWA